MSVHTEVHLENEICDSLAKDGWHHAKGDAEKYDRTRALFPDDITAWVKETQPKVWESLASSYGPGAPDALLDRLRKELDNRGTLDVLRHGVEMVGLRTAITLAQFRAALAGNAEIESRYSANRLRVVRQLRYSLHNENCIDLVLFLNGLPVATAELKTDFTQSVDDAVDQYRFDRVARPKGQASEPLLDFPRGHIS